MVFAIGTDSEGFRHFERFSGVALQTAVEAPHVIPVAADVELTAIPQKETAQSRGEQSLRFEAKSGAVQYLFEFSSQWRAVRLEN